MYSACTNLDRHLTAGCHVTNHTSRTRNDVITAPNLASFHRLGNRIARDCGANIRLMTQETKIWTSSEVPQHVSDEKKRTRQQKKRLKKPLMNGGNHNGIVYVSYSGYDIPKCGNPLMPCQTLAFAISVAHHGNTVMIDAGGRNHKHYVCSDIEGFDVWNKSLNVVGFNGRPRIGCEKEVTGRISLFLPSDNQSCYVEIWNVDIEYGFLSFVDCTIEIHGVSFYHSGIRNVQFCRFAEIQMWDTTWHGEYKCNENGSCKAIQITNFTCHSVNITMNGVRLYQTQFVVENYGRTNIYATNVTVTNDPTKTRYMGGLHLSFSSANANILIENSTFENQIEPTRVLSVINLYDAAVWLKGVRSGNSTTEAMAVLVNCRFINNERGVTLVGAFKKVIIEGCEFRDNIAMQAGAAILVISHESTVVEMQRCIFENNIAGSFRDDYQIQDAPGAFTEVGSEIHLDSECCKGVITLVGKGGAIRVQKGVVILNESRFINNIAKLLGGSMFVDIDGSLKVFNSYFENTHIHNHSLQGDVIYSDGKLDIKEVVIIARSAKNGLSILRHSGDHWSLDITNVWIECPTGYDLRTTNSSAYGVMDYGLRRSYKLDQLSYFCESCPRNKYSLDHGYLNYTMIFKSFAYITLLINGSQPKPAFTGSHFQHEIQCDDCPFGGHCVQGITSVANFWGFPMNVINPNGKPTGSVMKFQHCPKGYCCSTPECPAVDTCVNNRHGPLCGRCKDGFSEALFSPACIPNEKCGPVWLWPFGFGLGLFYSLFLMFQVDLKNFLFAKPLILKQCKFKNSTKKPYMVGNGSVPHNHTDEADAKFISPTPENHVDSGKENDAQMNNDTTNNIHSNPFTASDSGFIIILFYYFQDALLLNVKTVYVTSENPTAVIVKNVLSGLFQFQLDLFEVIKEVCAVADTTAVPKLITKAFLVPYVIFTFASVYAFYRWTNLISNSFSHTPRNGRHAGSSPGRITRKSFISRLSSGFILALLFMFQKMSTTTFTLLNCVPIYDRQVLFIDGWVTCYQYWQYGVLAYALTCTVPFFVVLMVGPALLVASHISLLQFFLACICPLPFLLYWFVRWLLRRKKQRTLATPPRHLPEGTQAVLQVLQGPFKQNTLGLCWAGVLIGRRLILVLLSTFVNDILIRLLGMLLSCFLILLHHVHVQPYQDKQGNIAGTISAAALVTLGTINLVRAGFEAAEYRPTGPNAYIMKIFGEIENALLLWLPVCALALVALLFIIRVAACSLQCNPRLDQFGEVEVVEAEQPTPHLPPPRLP
ncbi:hypothetical protein CAPTEDRAFT_199481 [Capitella teleta]|uniref:Right handed beta helix domain-containing protein n=1 Tax=Capitella teleta TaxID=283909 RepID=R7V7J6_CAPTE|nr:hypothetical protein CAPTEDRAFT_199481 [Capitella teleta]|eukprot:ELU14529.1 hypothetical protein CAPTEDRAFT_199481 [Capitella teleta]